MTSLRPGVASAPGARLGLARLDRPGKGPACWGAGVRGSGPWRGDVVAGGAGAGMRVGVPGGLGGRAGLGLQQGPIGGRLEGTGEEVGGAPG